MQIPFYDETIKPWLFTTHMLGWKGFFYVKGEDGVTIDGSIENIAAIIKSAAILLAYTACFLAVAIYYFRKKDILSWETVWINSIKLIMTLNWCHEKKDVQESDTTGDA